MNKIELSEFNIYERLDKGTGRGSFLAKYPDKSLILINTKVTSISQYAQQKLRITKEDRVVFSERNGIKYMAVLPIDSSIKGYKVQIMNNSKSMYIASTSLIKRGFKGGYYELKEPIYSGGIDWFEIEPFDF